MTNRYVIEIFYSDEDGGFIAAVPELPGCSAFGETDDALVEVKTAIALRLETAAMRTMRERKAGHENTGPMAELSWNGT
ncbi:MAG TPA: type II toxin-antitoxin system HicB family antitoxin [Methanoregulaceae archaeon]|nr:type II toxin-antitoxin system HicB family antitoxin [Methanoregulaceae archaeon]